MQQICQQLQLFFLYIQRGVLRTLPSVRKKNKTKEKPSNINMDNRKPDYIKWLILIKWHLTIKKSEAFLRKQGCNTVSKTETYYDIY